VLGCGGSEEPAPTLEDDVIALQASVAADTCPGALEDVDRAVEEDKPVRAARLLRSAGIPAAARQVARLRDTPAHTSEGIGLRQEGVTLYEARRRALAAYADVLERGVVEDFALVVALDGQRQADAALGAYLSRLEELRPLSVEPAPSAADDSQASGAQAPER